MFFNSWASLGEKALLSVLVYAGLVIIIRLSGKRTLGEMNAFDLIVTIALGSIVGSTILSSSVVLLEGLAALLVLIALQAVVSWASARWSPFRHLVTSRPTLVAYDGAFLRDVMRRARIAEQDVLMALRMEGFQRLDDVLAVVLETQGTLAVIERQDGPTPGVQVFAPLSNTPPRT